MIIFFIKKKHVVIQVVKFHAMIQNFQVLRLKKVIHFVFLAFIHALLVKIEQRVLHVQLQGFLKIIIVNVLMILYMMISHLFNVKAVSSKTFVELVKGNNNV